MRVKSALLAAGFMILCSLAFGYGVKGAKGNLDLLVFQKQTLRVTETTGDLDSMRSGLRGANAMESFLKDNGNAWKFTVDRRRGEFSLLEGGAIPMLPGLRSKIVWDAFGQGCSSNECIRIEDAEAAARQFWEDNAANFPAGQDEFYLDREGSGPFGSSIYFLRFQWAPQGIPVEGAGISFRINSGNLIQVSTSLIGKFDLNTLPVISAETAMNILSGYIGGSLESDRFVERGTLTIIPAVPAGAEIESFSGVPGTGISYALAYRFVFTREGETGTWEGLVDANTGELLRFVDMNRYGWVHGVVYPADGHNNQADRPFPYVATGLPSPNEYSDIGGRFAGDTATLNLGAGKYTRIVDACGATTITTTDGDADYGESIGQDCGVPDPNPGSGGNTYSSKVQYYHLTQVNMKARTYYPSNSWLNNSYITVNVNNSPTCNASSGGSALYFYKAAGGCWNLGEIPGVSVHEWGHSFDNYDGSGGGSPPLETRADWTATLQYRDSCTGRGAFLGDDCWGYQDACTDCDGIREADYMKHSKQTPWTPANNGTVYNCSSGGYNGPCGWEDHCESGISTQALWDLVARDLPSHCGLDLPTSWQLVERLSYLSMAQLGNMYNCDGSTKTSDGCGGSTLYTLFRALDDDGDGTANGTPHAAAIFAALKRHNIACGASGDSANQNQTSCPGLSAPVLSAITGSEAVTLNVTPVTNASRYIFYRNETGCDSGFTKIGTAFAPTTSFVDSTPVNGMTYYYRSQAMTASDACAGPMSNCVTIVPQPCTGMVILDKSMAGCVATDIGVTVLDSTAASPVTLSVFSTSHPTPVELTLANNPPGSATYTGSFQTTTGTPGAGQVGVQAGDTVTARYVDPDYCGEPDHDVDVSFPVDCTPPVISNVHVSAMTDSTATISWTTDEPANSRIYYGISTPPVTVAEDLVNFSTQHSLTITGLSGCTIYNYYVGSYDGAQNYSQNNNSGSYYSFRTDQRVYLFGPDTVEGGTGIWTASGGGTSIWHRDNCKANSGSWSWKAGASDSPACTANYGASVTTYLTSGGINLGAAGHGYHLRFREWYSTESGCDFCTVQVSTNGTTYTDLSPQRSGSSGGWVSRDYDLSAYSGTVNIRFRFTSDNYSNSLGWFVDDIDVSYDTPCAASFAVSSAVFADDCLGTGSGDGDGYLDPGEEAVVTVALNNTGYLAATGVWAELDTTVEGVTVLDGTASFPGIPVGGSGTSVSPHFRIRLAETVACGTVMPFTVSAHSSEGDSEGSFDLEVGHWVNPVTNLISESFDGTTFPPTGWTKADTSGSTGDWLRSTDTVKPTGGGTHSGSWLAYFKATTSGDATRLYRTSDSLIPSGSVSAQVSFWMYHDTGFSTKHDKIQVQVSTNGTTWTIPGSNQFLRCNGSTGWQQHSVDLSSYIGQSIRIGFLGTWMGGNYCHIDDVVFSYNGADYCVINSCTPPSCVTPSAPSITGISDDDACLQNGITITFAPGSPATRHDLYRDGFPVQSGVSSPTSHDPGDTASHGYIVRAVNGSDDCYTDSASGNFADGVCSAPPEIATGSSGSDAQTWSEDKATQSWPSASGASGYHLYRGALADLANLSGSGTDSCTRYDGTGTSVNLSSDDPSAVPGGFYWYLVTAYNGAGEGSAGAGRTVNSSGACAP